MTTSLIHEKTSSVLVVIIGVIAEEAGISLGASGRSTLKRKDLNEGTGADASFYTKNESLMRNREQINLPGDPPPDLAIEVEITRRLGVRKSIYEDLGVPEIWVYGTDGLRILVRQQQGYVQSESSPTFPKFSPREITAFVQTGVRQEQGEFTRTFRRRVRQILDLPAR